MRSSEVLLFEVHALFAVASLISCHCAPDTSSASLILSSLQLLIPHIVISDSLLKALTYHCTLTADCLVMFLHLIRIKQTCQTTNSSCQVCSFIHASL